MRWSRFHVAMLLLKTAHNSRVKEGNRCPMTGFIPTFSLLMITGEDQTILRKKARSCNLLKLKKVEVPVLPPVGMFTSNC